MFTHNASEYKYEYRIKNKTMPNDFLNCKQLIILNMTISIKNPYFYLIHFHVSKLRHVA